MLQPSFCVAVGYVRIFGMSVRTVEGILDAFVIWGATWNVLSVPRCRQPIELERPQHLATAGSEQVDCIVLASSGGNQVLLS